MCGKSEREMNGLLNELNKSFSIKETKAEYFVGMHIERDEKQNKIRIHQKLYTELILKRFNMENCNPC